MTLLKNDGVLPLPKSLHSLAVIAPNAAVARHGDYEEESNGLHISVVEGLRKELPGTTIPFNEGNDIAQAVARARRADAVILALGERPGISGEGHDRSTLDLPGNQEALLEAVYAANPHAVLVLQNGRPLTVTWAKEHLPAIEKSETARASGEHLMVLSRDAAAGARRKPLERCARILGVDPWLQRINPKRAQQRGDWSNWRGQRRVRRCWSATWSRSRRGRRSRAVSAAPSSSSTSCSSRRRDARSCSRNG